MQPSVSVIVLNYNGRAHLEPCFESLLQQQYDGPIELIMVDNGSSDGSAELMRARFPQVRLLVNERNLGFAPAVNQAAAQASGDYLALLNNDARAARDWVAQLVEQAERGRGEGVVCIGSRVLDWEGQRIDFVQGAVNFHGFGAQPLFRLPADRVHPGEEPLLFANGGAMVVDRRVFLEVGGLDEDFFAYFEDVDFGWRLWVCGYQVRLNPRAVAYHRHHATASTMYAYQTRLLFERNALMTIIKNYSDEHIQRILPVALLLLIERAVMEAGDKVDRSDFDLRRRDGRELYPTMELPKSLMSCLLAVDDIVKMLPRLYAKRDRIQAMRRRDDAEILPLFRSPLSANFGAYYPYNVLVEQMEKHFNIPELFAEARPTRVLILSSDPLRPELAGTGIRAVEMARVLSRHCQVTLAAYERADYPLEGVTMLPFSYDEPELVERLVESADVLILQGFIVTSFPFLTATNKIVVVDLYDPFPLGNLEFFRVRSPKDARTQHGIDMLVLRYLLGLGDFFVCASEEQRAYWMGALTLAGRLSPPSYADDRTLRRLIDLAPFGLSSEPPQHTRPVLKGVVPGIGPDDTVLLWGGGIWEWFDPPTLLRAMVTVGQQRPDIKLFFLGRGHPNTRDVPEMQMYERTLQLADELGLRDRTVFFNTEWVPYAERQNYLLEADIGVSTHFDSTETDFSFRTRILDYLWAGLPMVVSGGDTLSELVCEQGLGAVVAPGDADGLAEAILRLAAEPDARASRAERMAQVRERFTWERTLAPLVAFCRNPYHAADALERRPHGTPAHGDVIVTSPELVKRMNHLDEVVAEKNQHIAELKQHIQRLEGGRVLRALSLVQRVVRRK
ncbi:MAG TPA: glycosyltransferase [Roseiflexaceae bacterium]|nr:glycosyltransferase [Roseiflexaceae bacterium]